MSAASREAFARAARADPVDLARACLLVGAEVEQDLDPATGLRALDDLAAAARADVPLGGSPTEVAEGLRRALGGRAGFAGSGDDYADVRGSLLHEVLRRHSGLPLTLSVVWVEVCRRLGVPAHAVALPGHVVVAVGGDRPVHVDPFAGGTLLAPADLSALVRRATGRPLRPEHLDPADPVDVLLRLLTNVRALAARSDALLGTARTRLWAVELSLLLPRSPLVLRRERGELLVRLGDHRGGAAEIEAWAEVVEAVDPQAAEQARRSARLARSRLN